MSWRTNSIVVGGVSMNLALGSLYAWSVFVPPLEREFGWTRAQTSWVYTIAIVCFALSFVVAGRIQDVRGPRVCACVGGLLVSAGFVLASFTQSLAMLYFRKGDFDNGVGWLKKRLEVEGNNPEVYYLIGVQAWDRSYHFPDLDPALRSKIVEEGLEALNKAVQMKPDYFKAMAYLNLLYRQQAVTETDPAKQQALIAEADKIRNQVEIVRRDKSVREIDVE